jgi:Mg-chelatase subunit ChlD
MGLCYQTSRWLDRLWGEHLELSEPARQLVHAGITKQGDPFAGFPADLHARLYLPTDPAALEPAPSWATKLHTLAAELGEWQRLRVMCSRNGFAATIAAEAMLEQLLPHVPQRPPSQPGTQPDPSHNHQQTQPDGPGDLGQHEGEPGQGRGQKTPQKGPQDLTKAIPENTSQDNHLRAAIRKAIRTARDAVQEAEAGLEGMSTPLGLSLPGTSVATNSGPANLAAIREAHSRVSSSHRLRRIAELAGRLERVAAAKARSKVRPGVGEVHGITLGGDLARLLPSELVALRRPRLRLHLLARLLQGKALCYSMEGREPQSRGPIVVLLDESGSMREADKDVWSKAVALALLSTATKQKRAWHMVAFNGAITREVTIPAGKATANDIQKALDHGCSGGTDFDAPVLRAVEIIRESPTMKQADVVVITDGEDDPEPATIETVRSITRSEGVSWFCIGVGPDANAGLQSLAPIATSMVRVRDTDDPEPIIPIINLERERS